MENEPEMIRQQMLETRTALSEKLETLEEEVTGKIKGTTDSVVETVETVKEAVENTVQTVEKTVEKTVESVKETLDLGHHVEQHPWLMLGGAVLFGYVAGRLVDRLTAPPITANGVAPDRGRAPEVHTYFQAPPPRSEPGWGAEVVDALKPAMSKLGELAIGVTTGLLGEMVLEQLPATLHHDVNEVLDDITVALGGKPLHGFMAHEPRPQPAADMASSTRQIP
jgi:ElaB/YqjD/DUF883 family membrane-anchored ribosome-binding protein